ncbi:MAG: GNAT family N-acetyltransferase [Planctomycetota bacterium]|nr:GNAT family N-acetyltransferase [Planctomycetota bacterium]
MEGIPIRNARRGDIPSLLLLWGAMMREFEEADARFALHPGAREYMATTFAAWIQDPTRIVVVAEERGRLVVGFAAGVVLAGNGWQVPVRLGRISDTYVAAPRRRQGLARRLAGRVMDLLYEKGVDTVRLAAAVRNEGALAFWRSMGWSDLEVVLERPVEPDAD